MAVSHFLAQVAKDFFARVHGGSLVLGLTTINVLGFYPKLFVGLCVIRAEAENFSRGCITSMYQT